MADRRRPSYYSAEARRRGYDAFWGEENNDSGVSEDEEAELEHHFQVFSEESR